MLQVSGQLTTEMYQDSVLDHRDIATAILHGDGDAAEMAMRRHVERAYSIANATSPSLFRR